MCSYGLLACIGEGYNAHFLQDKQSMYYRQDNTWGSLLRKELSSGRIVNPAARDCQQQIKRKAKCPQPGSGIRNVWG